MIHDGGQIRRHKELKYNIMWLLIFIYTTFSCSISYKTLEFRTPWSCHTWHLYLDFYILSSIKWAIGPCRFVLFKYRNKVCKWDWNNNDKNNRQAKITEDWEKKSESTWKWGWTQWLRSRRAPAEDPPVVPSVRGQQLTVACNDRVFDRVLDSKGNYTHVYIY